MLRYTNGLTLKEIGEILSVGDSTLSDWLKEVIKEAKEEQKRKIIELYLRCLTREEIASKIGLTQERIGQIIRKFISEEISTVNLVPESLQLFNVWNFMHACRNRN
jgi:DNA-directed RNA polymerase specialized sigma subunit